MPALQDPSARPRTRRPNSSSVSTSASTVETICRQNRSGYDGSVRRLDHDDQPPGRAKRIAVLLGEMEAQPAQADQRAEWSKFLRWHVEERPPTGGCLLCVLKRTSKSSNC